MPLRHHIFAALPMLALAACNSPNATPDPDPVTHPTTSTAFSPEPTFSFEDTPHDKNPSYEADPVTHPTTTSTFSPTPTLSMGATPPGE